MSLEKQSVSEQLAQLQEKDESQKKYSQTDLRFISSLSAAVVQKSTQSSKILLWVIFSFAMTFIAWMVLTTIDEVTLAEGKIIPSHQIQKVQYLEGGVITEILIKEGDVVKKGQALIHIDSVGFETEFQESQVRLSELQAKAARLKAQVDDKEIVFDPSLQNEFPEIVKEETSLFHSSMSQIESKVDILQEQLKQKKNALQEAKNKYKEFQERYKLIKKELKLTEPLVKNQLVSKVEFLKLKRQASEIKGEFDSAKLAIAKFKSQVNEATQATTEEKLNFINKSKKEYNEVISEIARIEHGNSLLKDKVRKAVLRSPVDGTIKQLLSNTVGGVIHPGRDVVEIVPLEDSLIVEVNVRPSDIAYLHKDQDAIVKLSAYDFAIYGGLNGKVIHISADTITNEQGENYYLVRIKTDKRFLSYNGKEMKIMAGMTVTASILTGKKTIFDYIMKPIFKAKNNALRER